MKSLLLALISSLSYADIFCHLIFNNPHAFSIKTIESAYMLANRAHAGVIRKFEQLPYIVHPNRVAKDILKYTKDQDLVIAALLHDVVEDSQITLMQIEESFGTRVASLVEELTSNPKEIERLGKTAYLVKKLNSISDEALLIKLLDRKDNLKDLALGPRSFVEKSSNSTFEIIEQLNRPLTENHIQVIEQIESLLTMR